MTFDPKSYLTPGPTQDRVLDGIVQHAYKNHSNEFTTRGAALSESQFRELAKESLNSADRAVSIQQGNSRNLLVSDKKQDATAWINTNKPGSSTYFKPRDGLDQYLSRKLAQTPPTQRQEIDLKAIRQSAPKIIPPKAPAPKPAAAPLGKAMPPPPKAPAPKPAAAPLGKAMPPPPKAPAPRPPAAAPPRPNGPTGAPRR